MPTLVTSPRALLAALVPLLALHLFAVPLIATVPDGQRFQTPDAIVIALATRLSVEAAALLGLHLLAKRGGVSRRSAYAALGAIAAVAAYAITISVGWWPRLASEGATITTGLVPAAAGALAGILYYQVAGLDWGVEPPAVAAPGQAGTASGPVPSSYAGPLQVRSSATAFILTALGPSILCGLIMFPSLFGSLLGLNGISPKPLRTGQSLLGYAAPFYVMLLGVPSTAAPTALFVWAGHALARAFDRIDYRAYALAGAAVGAGLPLVLSAGRLGVAVLPFAMLGAAVMSVYRRLAGLEPKPLPEHVVVTRPETLVPGSHPARQGHRVLLQR
jgi:hypothetical protein